jgi:thiol-disulfide isomerase/thioredoxin
MVLPVLLALLTPPAEITTLSPEPAPSLTGTSWWNTQVPVKLGGGKVTIVHFWTFGCSNCQANQPVYKAWTEKYRGTNVQIVGIHTPELASERKLRNVATYIRQEKILYPTVFDADSINWTNWRNRFWPAVYIVDKAGKMRYMWEGELRWNGADGDKQVEAKVAQLRAERPK